MLLRHGRQRPLQQPVRQAEVIRDLCMQLGRCHPHGRLAERELASSAPLTSLGSLRSRLPSTAPMSRGLLLVIRHDGFPTESRTAACAPNVAVFVVESQNQWLSPVRIGGAQQHAKVADEQQVTVLVPQVRCQQHKVEFMSDKPALQAGEDILEVKCEDTSRTSRRCRERHPSRARPTAHSGADR